MKVSHADLLEIGLQCMIFWLVVVASGHAYGAAEAQYAVIFYAPLAHTHGIHMLPPLPRSSLFF